MSTYFACAFYIFCSSEVYRIRNYVYLWARVVSYLKPFHDFALGEVTAATSMAWQADLISQYFPGCIPPGPSHSRPAPDTVPLPLLISLAWILVTHHSFRTSSSRVTLLELVGHAGFKLHPRPQGIWMHSDRYGSKDTECSFSPRRL